MHQVWEYENLMGERHRGIFTKCTDRGGTDVTYWFHRLDANDKPIVFSNGGIQLDLIGGSLLKSTKRVGALPVQS